VETGLRITGGTELGRRRASPRTGREAKTQEVIVMALNVLPSRNWPAARGGKSHGK